VRGVGVGGLDEKAGERGEDGGGPEGGGGVAGVPHEEKEEKCGAGDQDGGEDVQRGGAHAGEGEERGGGVVAERRAVVDHVAIEDVAVEEHAAGDGEIGFVDIPDGHAKRRRAQPENPRGEERGGGERDKRGTAGRSHGADGVAISPVKSVQ